MKPALSSKVTNTSQIPRASSRRAKRRWAGERVLADICDFLCGCARHGGALGEGVSGGLDEEAPSVLTIDVGHEQRRPVDDLVDDALAAYVRGFAVATLDL